jgi:hypothetical protein
MTVFFSSERLLSEFHIEVVWLASNKFPDQDHVIWVECHMTMQICISFRSLSILIIIIQYLNNFLRPAWISYGGVHSQEVKQGRG